MSGLYGSERADELLMSSPLPPLSPSLISLAISENVKRHVKKRKSDSVTAVAVSGVVRGRPVMPLGRTQCTVFLNTHFSNWTFNGSPREIGEALV